LLTKHHRFRTNEERTSVSCMSSIDVDKRNISSVHCMNEAIDIFHMRTGLSLQEWCTKCCIICRSC